MPDCMLGGEGKLKPLSESMRDMLEAFDLTNECCCEAEAEAEACPLQLLEWWFTSAEQKLADQRKLPIPPPPPPVHPHPNGVQMPDDPTMCPICRQPRTNPAMAVASGYVFCYPCIFGHISQFECCPVTRLPTNVDHIRRLYYSH